MGVWHTSKAPWAAPPCTPPTAGRRAFRPSARSAKSSPAALDRRLPQRIEIVPVAPDVGDDGDVLIEVHRLHDIAVHAEQIAFGDVPVLLGGSEDDYRNPAGPLVGLDSPQYFQSVDLGQLQVEQYELGCWRIGARAAK